MNEYHSHRRNRPEKHRSFPNSGDQVKFLLKAEEEIVQSISARAPLPNLLDKICGALDCGIGNVISLISLAGDGASDLDVIAVNASLFGLHTFCCDDVLGENDEPLGSLRMYCCVPRCPSAGEIQLIERAKCLAAIAITRANEADHQGSCGSRGSRLVQGSVLEWPVSTN
jgi:hypothetical protein